MAFFFLPTPPHVLTEPGFDSHLFCLGRHIIALLLKNAEGVRPTFFCAKSGVEFQLSWHYRIAVINDWVATLVIRCLCVLQDHICADD